MLQKENVKMKTPSLWFLICILVTDYAYSAELPNSKHIMYTYLFEYTQCSPSIL